MHWSEIQGDGQIIGLVGLPHSQVIVGRYSAQSVIVQGDRHKEIEVPWSPSQVYCIFLGLHVATVVVVGGVVVV